MGYLYRPMLKGKEPNFVPTPGDLALSRGRMGTGRRPATARADVITSTTARRICALGAVPASGRPGGRSTT